jgi:hypothetical protein
MNQGPTASCEARWPDLDATANMIQHDPDLYERLRGVWMVDQSLVTRAISLRWGPFDTYLHPAHLAQGRLAGIDSGCSHGYAAYQLSTRM